MKTVRSESHLRVLIHDIECRIRGKKQDITALELYLMSLKEELEEAKKRNDENNK